MSFVTYPTDKETLVSWLGTIPQHWRCLPARRIFSQIREPALPGDEQLSATQKYGVIPQRLFMETADQKVVLALAGTGNFKHVEHDDFVISLRSFQGGIEWSGYAGCVSPAYTVLRVRQQIIPQYWAFLLKSDPFVSALQATTEGIRDGKTIGYEQFGLIPVPCPSVQEQLTIATFLNRETGKIDALVAEQERLIALLKEKRQAVISHAVTKGLDPHALMKPSGVEWVGDLPTGWDIKPLKLMADFINGEAFKPSDWRSEGTPIIRIQNLNGGDEFNFYAGEVGTQHHVQTGDLLFGWSGNKGTSFGPFVWKRSGTFYLNQHIFKVLPAGCDPAWLHWCLRGVTQYVEQQAHGIIGMVHVTKGALGAISTPVPPRRQQHDIGVFLDRETTKLDALTTEAQHTITLLNERRAALISAAVTGKIDVRHLANPAPALARSVAQPAIAA